MGNSLWSFGCGSATTEILRIWVGETACGYVVSALPRGSGAIAGGFWLWGRQEAIGVPSGSR